MMALDSTLSSLSSSVDQLGETRDSFITSGARQKDDSENLNHFLFATCLIPFSQIATHYNVTAVRRNIDDMTLLTAKLELIAHELNSLLKTV